MRPVVDSNVVIAGLLREGVTRRLLMEAPVDFVGPESMLSEIKRHRKTISDRAGLTSDEFDLLVALLTERIDVVPRPGYDHHMEEANTRIGMLDPGDVPFLALALALGCDGVWTYNQKHFEGAGVEIWATADVAAWTRSANV